MTRGSIWPWAVGIAAPAVLGAIGAVALLVAGETRSVVLASPLPVAVLGTGLVVAAAVAVALLVRVRRRRSARRAAHALAEARTRGADDERAGHRTFLARLDHELKNPLTAILATAAGRDDAEWRTVDAQARKLGCLVRDLRKLAELETRELDRERVELEPLIAEAVQAITDRDASAGARIRVEATRVPWPIPPVHADPDLLALVFDNVLGNAVKYSQAGPIEVRLREDGGWAVVEVADAGRGIPASDLPTVFDELARAGNARDVAGSGLGLTLVSTVLSRHGGDAVVRSVEGAGSVVVMRLPRA